MARQMSVNFAGKGPGKLFSGEKKKSQTYLATKRKKTDPKIWVRVWANVIFVNIQLYRSTQRIRVALVMDA